VVGNNGACAITPTETEGPFPSLVPFFRSVIREGKPGTTLTTSPLTINGSTVKVTQIAFPDTVIGDADRDHGVRVERDVPGGDRGVSGSRVVVASFPRDTDCRCEATGVSGEEPIPDGKM
jgi:hypothetical protein